MPPENAARRSAIMRAVPSEKTTPEIALRKMVAALGFRSRANVAKLPGKPDLVIAKSRAVIFVNGCFWHGHKCQRGDRVPEHNRDYWVRKIARNAARDKSNKKELRQLGWRVLVVWECQIKNAPRIEQRLKSFLRA